MNEQKDTIKVQATSKQAKKEAKNRYVSPQDSLFINHITYLTQVYKLNLNYFKTIIKICLHSAIVFKFNRT